ncbi:MAG: metal-sensitive transcriptional regulator [Planctomycetota bacterium]
MVTDELAKKAYVRLSKIEGQVRGIKKAVNEKRYCIDILNQIAAAEAALHQVGSLVLKNHMKTCVVNAFRTNNRKDTQEKIDELINVYKRFKP